MSDNGYMIWFLATAVMIATVLTVGTLAAAGLLGRDKTPKRGGDPTDASGMRPRETAPGGTDHGGHGVHGARAPSETVGRR